MFFVSMTWGQGPLLWHQLYP